MSTYSKSIGPPSVACVALLAALLSLLNVPEVHAQGYAGRSFHDSQYRGQTFGYYNPGYSFGFDSRGFNSNPYSGYGSGSYIYGGSPYTTGYRYNYLSPYSNPHGTINYNTGGYYRFHNSYPGRVYRPYQSIWY